MAFDAKTERLLSLKKLSGKAHTSNNKGLSNEALPSGVTIAAASVFGQAIPATPTANSLYAITSAVVEYVRLSASFIQGSDTSDGQHGFKLTLPDDYVTRSSNPKKGTGFYTNGSVVNVAKGGLQLVPPSFGTGYEAKLYHTASSTETQIPLLDARDWNLDYYNGVIFQQDPPGTGFHSQNPAYVDAFIYIGDYVGSMLGNSGAGDTGATYIVLSNTGSLSGERALTAGTGLMLIDGGAGSSATLKADDRVLATLSGSVFSGVGKFNAGLSGSLTHLVNGKSYMKAGDNVQITTGSDGSVTIAASHLHIDGFDKNAQFLVLSATGSMNNERVFTAGTGIKATDGGNNSAYTVAIDNNVVATISGSTFTGPVKFNQGLSGSLTKIQSGLSYLVAGTNVTIASATNGQVTISAPTPSNAIDTSLRASPFVTFSASSVTSNERVLSAGPGILINTSEAGAISIESKALNLTRTKKTYDVTGSHPAGAGFSTPGIDYGSVGYSVDAIDVLLNGVLIHSGTAIQVSNSTADYTLSGNSQLKFSFDLEEDDVVDAIMITSGSFSSSYASKTAPYVTFGASGDLSNERVITAGDGITIDTSQANQVILAANITGLRQKVVYTVTGSHASGKKLTVPNINFSSGAYRDDSIDIFVNGVLMSSGSNEDYTLPGDTNKITMNFSLETNDKVIAIVQ